MAASYTHQTAGKIVGGPHCTRELAAHLRLFGDIKSALIVTQPSMIRQGIVEELRRQLSAAGIATEIETGIKPEPTVQNVEQVYDRISGQAFDLYIGLGGGSVLDAVKLLSVLATNPASVSEMIGTDLVGQAGIPTVMIPTTSGTGSEVTPNAIVTLPEEQLKIGIVSRHLLPQLVLIDPVLTVGLPQPITASTGMDAFTHALESFISNKANPLSDMFALESIRLISRSIAEAYRDGSSVTARERMLVGSMYGGMALTSAGTAAVHALAYPLGGKFHIPHGVANSMLLPHVMEFNMDAIAEDRLACVAEAMGLQTGGTKAKTADRIVAQIRSWTKELHIPQNLHDYGVTERDVAPLAEAAAKVTRLLNNNPKQVFVQDMQALYHKLLP
ncbi:iron-containing alcohol dehydrogenase [Paenibacillus piri]|uniref:Iron-containing alcohol dehydrogenase n=1 Tax=Paenibacillus piri TaxID=2547395 RepID=A0A4R5KS89_9BACL|nr:iron-containing alcohol dehydrogenase [Paenibacillus piri]TDF98709.1 iron-containing alcohol dehydrogenase [Paenibacillus piri]